MFCRKILQLSNKDRTRLSIVFHKLGRSSSGPYRMARLGIHPEDSRTDRSDSLGTSSVSE